MLKHVTFLHRVNDIPLKYKFLLIYFLCILLPVMAMNVFFYQRNSADIKVREVDNLHRSIERASGELLGMIDESVALSRSIARDESINAAIDRTYDAPVDYFETYYESLRNNLTRYMSAYPNILEIRIYTNNETIQTGTNYYVIGGRADDLPWLEQLSSKDGDILLASYNENSFLNSGRRISVLSKMNSYAAYSKHDKYLRIDLNADKIQSILSRESGYLRLLLIDEENRVVADSTDAEARSYPIASELPFMEDSESDYVIERLLGDVKYLKGWKIVGIADTGRIDSLLAAAGRSILWLAAVSTVIPTLLVLIILRSYHYRINKLARHMSKIQHERFERIFIPEGRDEIGALIRSYNVMTGKINMLINEVYKLEIQQKSLELERVRAELSALHSQVNPHFLFNTLNALLVVCIKNGYTDVASVVKNLSLLMRQLLGRKDDLVPLREELQYTTMYLQIEKFRFGDLFEYEFEADEDALGLRIPRMSIQPLVENACKHGLQAKKDNRMIKVVAKLEKDELAILVTDNGIGIEPYKLKQVLDNARSEQGGTDNIGIRNVYRRLELFYGGSARFRIASKPEHGTQAGFCIPLALLYPEGEKEGL